jgi:hypothetical protein
LRAIGIKARAAGTLIEIAVYGGAAIVLAFDFRAATKDVAVVVTGDPRPLRQLAAAVAREKGWDTDWMKDAVKGFVSARSSEGLRPFRSYPNDDEPGLRVLVPTAEYLLAMKCLAMRIDAADGTHDASDIHDLMRETGRTTQAQLVEVVEKFYPTNLVTPRVAFGIEQIADAYRERRDDV